MKEKSVTVNFIYNALFRVINVLIPFIAAPYTARVIGADLLGIQSYTESIAAYFAMFAALGVLTYGQREIAMNRNDRKKASVLFWEIEILVTLMTFICLGAWFVFILFTSKYKLYYLIQTILIVNVIFNITWLFGGFEEFKIISVRSGIVKILNLILLFVLVKDKSDLPIYVLLLGLSNFASYISLWPSVKTLIDKVPLKELHPFRHVKSVLQYFIPYIASSIYQYFDKVMLGVLTSGTAENGYYDQTTKIVNVILGLTISLDMVMEARMSYLFAEGKEEEIKNRLHTSIDFTLFICMPIAFGLCGIAANFIPWYLGAGFDKVIVLLCIYAFTIISTSLDCCIGGQYLTPCGYRNKSTVALIIGSCINLLLNYILIPQIDSIGATVATLVSETCIFFMYLYLARKVVSIFDVIKRAIKKIIAALAMFAVVVFIGKNAGANALVTIIQIGVGGIVYGIVVLVLKDSFGMFALGMVRGFIEGRRKG